MAVSVDALDEDEWWLEPEERRAKNNTRKRETEEDITKKRKRRKITDVLANIEPETHTALHSTARQHSELITSLKPHIDKLTGAEAEEIQLINKHFVSYKSHNEHLQSEVELLLSSYLRVVCPKWSKWIRKCTHMTHGAPLIIVLTSSAKRASEIKSHLGDFCSSEEVVKICAKNSKVEDHVTYLSGHVVHIVLATPNRLFKLIEAGALKLHQLKLLVVDWYWRNLKLKCFKDIPEVWSDFILLYITYINRLVQDNQCKIGLL